MIRAASVRKPLALSFPSMTEMTVEGIDLGVGVSADPRYNLLAPVSPC